MAELIHRDYRAPLEITDVGSNAICRRAHCVEYSPHVGLVEQACRFEPELGTDALHEAAVGREADIRISDGAPVRPRCGKRAAGTARGDAAAVRPLQRPVAALLMRELNV